MAIQGSSSSAGGGRENGSPKASECLQTSDAQFKPAITRHHFHTHTSSQESKVLGARRISPQPFWPPKDSPKENSLPLGLNPTLEPLVWGLDRTSGAWLLLAGPVLQKQANGTEAGHTNYSLAQQCALRRTPSVQPSVVSGIHPPPPHAFLQGARAT